MNGDLRIDEMLKSIDVYGRLAFGGQCVAVMAMIAGPLLFVTVCTLPFFLWDNDRGEAMFVWLAGMLLAAGLTAGGAAVGVFCWRWSGDWITEWPGYATAGVIALIANVALAWMLTSSPVPIYLSIAATMSAAFAAGCLVAGNLAGMQVLAETRQQRSMARRR